MRILLIWSKNKLEQKGAGAKLRTHELDFAPLNWDGVAYYQLEEMGMLKKRTLNEVPWAEFNAAFAC